MRIMVKATVGSVAVAVILASAFLVGAAGSARAQAKGPAFDCAKASGEIEQLICKDESLAALDRKLDEVYKAALAKAKDGVEKTLRAEQRGWVKGRNECWKAKDESNPMYLTESWTAVSPRACAEGQYQIRMTELQVRFQLVPSKKPVFFACNNNPANEVVATFFDTTPPAARFERGDQTVIAWQVRTASGAKYEGRNLSFWNKGDEATVTWLGEDLKCRVK